MKRMKTIIVAVVLMSLAAAKEEVLPGVRRICLDYACFDNCEADARKIYDMPDYYACLWQHQTNGACPESTAADENVLAVCYKPVPYAACIRNIKMKHGISMDTVPCLDRCYASSEC
jgi:hypothetical protein